MAHLKTILSIIAIIGFMYVSLAYPIIVLVILIIIIFIVLTVALYCALLEHFKSE